LRSTGSWKAPFSWRRSSEAFTGTTSSIATSILPTSSSAARVAASPSSTSTWRRTSLGGPIEVTVASDEECANLVVHDYGIGIPKEAQARIFERFERVAPLSQYGGLGLGLYIVKQIVQAHHGTIRVESEPQAGSIFTVDLPLRQQTTL
jgi:signal transduction histidine kinase